jgi:hypothetical protein
VHPSEQGDHRLLPRPDGALQGVEEVVFGPPPKTSTGKIQKFMMLRERAKTLASDAIGATAPRAPRACESPRHR